MDKDAESLCKFKKESIKVLFGEPPSHKPLTIVAMMYSGEICALDSNPKMKYVLPGLIPK